MNLNSLDTRILINDSGITQKKIAATIGITPEYLSRCLQKGVKPKMQERIKDAIKILKSCENRILEIQEFLPRHYWLEYWFYTDENMKSIEAYIREVYITGEDEEGIEVALVNSPKEVWPFEFKDYAKKKLNGWRIWDKEPNDSDRKKIEWDMR